ncbi:terpene synthase 6, chloroplastic isoform X2 [Amaranthus tricolor]|uniref:terpene synthase 6, chloroplastic isoform X2 n=1 Tax=Amaranthus tricolor TaxID=29722 RepID=UPI00258CD292|nr:terpene synthase 6, chloroplastic isoform X2 [Amaranthus tricolor]
MFPREILYSHSDQNKVLAKCCQNSPEAYRKCCSSQLFHLYRGFNLCSQQAYLGTSCSSTKASAESIQRFEDAKEKIRKMFNKVELSVSAYDTAWVAMASSPAAPTAPCFPGTINWILENQMKDGSWGFHDRCDTSLVKDALSSTLACVLALKIWSIGEEQMTKGLDFIVSNFASAMDVDQHSPIGFDVIFPSMIEKALDMDVNLHLASTDIDIVLQMKDQELKRIHGKKLIARNYYLAYISEAMAKSEDWRMIMKYQRKNGSLFNSPSTTAAAFSELHDTHCYSYLSSILQKYGNAVPTICPIEAYFRLYLVDTLQKLGIHGYFKEEISSVLNEIFRQWKQGDDEIFSDVTTMMAFRLLREHGYDVSTERLAEYHDKGFLFNKFGGHFEDTRAALEFFKASQLRVHDHEPYLEEQTSILRNFLERKISEHPAMADRLSKNLLQEVVDALKNPVYGSLERLESRKFIEHGNLAEFRVLKSSLSCTNFCYKVLLELAKNDFRYCQSIHMQEFKQLQRWLAESKLDQLTFSRQKLSYCYFSAAASLSSPKLSDARISWAKNSVLTTVIDDFFDVGSSKEEQLNLIQLVEEWDPNKRLQASSEKVHIIFSALSNTICEIGNKAYTWQDHSVTKHIVEIWLSLLKSMWNEAEIQRNMSVPSMEEYMENGYISFALGPIVLPALYFIGPKLSEEIIRSEEYHDLFKLMSTCGRLLNDFQGFQREAEHGKLNAVSLLMLQGNGNVSKEDAILEIKRTVDSKRRELLRLVLQPGNGGVVPKECREVFWKMSKVLHLFYLKEDGFTSEEMAGDVKAILHDPLKT